MAGLQLETIVVSAKGTDGVFHVELNRPERRNALNWRFWKDCRQVFETLAANSDCRAVVLSARGKGFSAGLDIQDPQNLVPQGEGDVARTGFRFIDHLTVMQEACTAIERCLKPTIVVIHGACIGAGVDLITACDVRLCTSDAYFCIREVLVGLAADVGTLARLPKIGCNDSTVRELALTGRDFQAAEAKDMGLVSRIALTFEQGLEDAFKIASQIAANSPVAVLGTKKNLLFARDHTVQDALDYVRTWNACMIQTEDMGKAMAAAMQKSKPTYSKL